MTAPAVDGAETEKAYEINAEHSFWTKERRVEVADGILTHQGEKQEDNVIVRHGVGDRHNDHAAGLTHTTRNVCIPEAGSRIETYSPGENACAAKR